MAFQSHQFGTKKWKISPKGIMRKMPNWRFNNKPGNTGPTKSTSYKNIPIPIFWALLHDKINIFSIIYKTLKTQNDSNFLLMSKNHTPLHIFGLYYFYKHFSPSPKTTQYIVFCIRKKNLRHLFSCIKKLISWNEILKKKWRKGQTVIVAQLWNKRVKSAFLEFFLYSSSMKIFQKC